MQQPTITVSAVKIPPDIICPITHEIMTDPVVLVESGHTYEREALLRWLEKNTTDPATGVTIQNKMIAPNITLKKMIESFLEEYPAWMEETYLPESVINSLIEAIQKNDSTVFTACLTKDNRLLKRDLKDNKNLLMLCCELASIDILTIALEKLSRDVLTLPCVAKDKGIALFLRVSHRLGLEGAKIMASAFEWTISDIQSVFETVVKDNQVAMAPIVLSLGATTTNEVLNAAYNTRKTDMIKILILGNKAFLDETDSSGNNLLMRAILDNYIELSTWLLSERGVRAHINLNTTNALKETPLGLAYRMNDMATLALLVLWKGEVSDILLQAIEDKRTALIQFLLTEAAHLINPNISTSTQKSVLMVAIEKNQAETVSLLLNHPKINIYQRDSAGNQALHYATQANHQESIKRLIKKGASIKDKNRDQRTPLQLAEESNQPELANWMKSKYQARKIKPYLQPLKERIAAQEEVIKKQQVAIEELKQVQQEPILVSSASSRGNLIKAASLLPGEADYQAGNFFYMHGHYQLSLSHFEKAASQNYPAAYLRLWRLCQGDQGIPKDEQKRQRYVEQIGSTFAWFEGEAKEGGADAQTNLGRCYQNGLGVKQDVGAAVKYFQLAADQGYALAQFNLGWCYLKGEGVEKNAEQEVRYFQLAADQGHAEAQFNSGVYYANGKGVAKNMEQALKYYRMAAVQGHAMAQFNLGICYAKGEGVAKNMEQAMKYYRLAADGGSVDAKTNLENLLKQYPHFPCQQTSAFKFFTSGSTSPNPSKAATFTFGSPSPNPSEAATANNTPGFDFSVPPPADTAKQTMPGMPFFTFGSTSPNPSEGQGIFDNPLPKPAINIPKLLLAPKDESTKKDLVALLKWVTEGQLIEVEKLLQKNPELALMTGTVTDLYERIFNDFTVFQYAAWAYDIGMCEVILEYLDNPNALAQLQSLEAAPEKYSRHGAHYDITPLVTKTREYLDNFRKWDCNKCCQHWQKEVGGAQRQCPAWLIYAWCEKKKGNDVAWVKKDLATLKFTRQYDRDLLKWWFTQEYNNYIVGGSVGKLGSTWGVVRGTSGGFEQGLGGVGVVCDPYAAPEAYAVAGLSCWRTVANVGHDLEVSQSVGRGCHEALRSLKTRLENPIVHSNSSMRFK